MELVEYNINTGFNNKDVPYIFIEMSYKDNFTDDNYIMEGLSKDSSAEMVNFNIYKNGNYLCNLNLNKNENNKFLKEFFKIVDDYDFKSCFNKKHADNFSQKILEFTNKCSSSMVLNGKLMEGYKDKMRMMAGITINESIR